MLACNKDDGRSVTKNKRIIGMETNTSIFHYMKRMLTSEKRNDRGTMRSRQMLCIFKATKLWTNTVGLGSQVDPANMGTRRKVLEK